MKIRDVMLCFFVATLMLGSATYGSKRPHIFHKIYNQAQTIFGIQTEQENRLINQLRQPYLNTSVLDLPSKLHPRDYQVYLERLREKYMDRIRCQK